MRCSVVFGVTSRLLVIIISSSSLTTNTATYYQRCVITCETVAVVHRRSCWQHVACCSANSKHESEIGSESRFMPTPPLFDAPVRGGGSHRNIAMPFGVEKLEWCGYPMVNKNLLICLFVSTQLTNVTDTRTHTDTAWRHRPRLYHIIYHIISNNL